MSKSKSLSESAAEILAASLGSAAKEPSLGGQPAVDLGGETPTTEPTAIGAAAAANAKEAPKPGSPGAPAEAAKSLGQKPKKVADEEEEAEDEAEDIAANEEVEYDDDDELELTEEEVEEYLNSLSEEELEALSAEIETLDEEDESEEEEEEDESEEEEVSALTEEQIAEARKTAVKKLVSDNMGSCKEDIDALFSGESLSEEFKNKATTIFETAVRSRVEQTTKKIVEDNDAAVAATVAEMEAQLTDQVDEYMNYVVEQWLEDNKLAVDSGLRVEIAEDFMAGLKNLFLEHYIEVPEDKADLVEELAKNVAESDSKLEEQVKTNADLTKRLNESIAVEVLRKICDGLTEVQVAKIKTLAESVEFTTEGDYSQKLAVIRESYFPTKKGKIESPETVVETGDGKEVSSTMDRYVNAITKQVPKY
jgi:hypothetical protein